MVTFPASKIVLVITLLFANAAFAGQTQPKRTWAARCSYLLMTADALLTRRFGRLDIEWAALKKKFRWQSTLLGPKGDAAIAAYWLHSYVINFALSKNDLSGLNSADLGTIQTLEEILSWKESINESEFFVYRAISHDEVGRLRAASLGQIVPNYSFKSASLSWSAANSYREMYQNFKHDSLTVKIIVPKGQRLIVVTNKSANEFEYELILSNGSDLKVEDCGGERCYRLVDRVK